MSLEKEEMSLEEEEEEDTVVEPEMNTEQQAVLEHVKKGENVFMTGSAGTGKSFTIKKIQEWASSNEKLCAITSSTGTSALTIKGTTIHSFLGIGLAKKSAEELFRFLQMRDKKKILNLQRHDMIIIDEVSMISDELLDKISEFLILIKNYQVAFLRRQYAPFGGIQIILCGDMFQLPPVQGNFCFHAKIWKDAKFKCIDLIQQMRQSGDATFAKLLNEVRLGLCTDETLALLKKCTNPNFGEIQPTILFSKNINVDIINDREFHKLVEQGAKTKVYKTIFSDNPITPLWAQSLKIPEQVELCIGAQVMLTVNLDVKQKLCNGSRGVVIDFGFHGDEGVVVLFKDGSQFLIQMHKIEDENEEIEDKKKGKGKEKEKEKEKGKEEHEEKEVKKNCVSATFMPLKLAYALTIHKSQSMTLDAAIVDLSSIFAPGQAYVALSRVRNLDSVKILNVNKKAFKASEEVMEFYNELKFVT